jgi:hypothetical protein
VHSKNYILTNILDHYDYKKHKECEDYSTFDFDKEENDRLEIIGQINFFKMRLEDIKEEVKSTFKKFLRKNKKAFKK